MPVSRVDLDKCVGCGTCVESCPMDVFRLDTVVEYRQEVSPCSAACPLGLRQREYHDLLGMGMIDAAAAVLAECHPMPAITGRLCSHPCESECSRGAVDASININALEQYLGDHLLEWWADRGLVSSPALTPGVAGRVAVIGSGPAGLSAAYFLAREGFAVTVFEKESRPGGLLQTVVPAFRLPPAVLDAQIAAYEALGMEFRTDVQIGRDVSIQELGEMGFRAVVAATGAARPLRLTVPGSEAAGILTAMEFLAAGKEDAGPVEGRTVAVIGGGSVALDAARTALRLGAEKVTVVCLECLESGLKDSMLASAKEIEQAQAEGVEILPSRGVDSFLVEEGHVSGVRVVECLSVRDEDGRFEPVYGECSLPEPVVVNTVIVAIGRAADPELVPTRFATDARGRIVVDPDTLTAGPGLFAAGDAVSGASTVVQALAAGKKAAEAVASFLRDEHALAGSERERTVAVPPAKEKVETLERNERTVRPAALRSHDLAEVTAGFTAAQARREAERCLTCGSRSRIAYLDDCQVCRLCQKYCPVDAIEVTEGALLGSLHGWNVVELGR
jgi:NADPH-dependent glutamate synthase beta subunit-like oxidoreductase